MQSVVLNVVCSPNVYFLEEKIINLFFVEPHKYQLWVYIYQARDLIAKDESGMNGRCSRNALTSGYFHFSLQRIKGTSRYIQKESFRRRKLNSVSNVFEAAPIYLFWVPNGLNELPVIIYVLNFLSSWLANRW